MKEENKENLKTFSWMIEDRDRMKTELGLDDDMMGPIYITEGLYLDPKTGEISESDE
jgi:hypothetical protein